jgi:hypothetical protein
MALTLIQFVEATLRGETEEKYKKRVARIRRLANERDNLIDSIEVLGDDPRADKKRARLERVEKMIEELI